MSQEETPSVFVSKKVMCHLLIYKRNIEKYIEKSNFKLFLAYVAIIIFLY